MCILIGWTYGSRWSWELKKLFANLRHLLLDLSRINFMKPSSRQYQLFCLCRCSWYNMDFFMDSLPFLFFSMTSATSSCIKEFSLSCILYLRHLEWFVDRLWKKIFNYLLSSSLSRINTTFRKDSIYFCLCLLKVSQSRKQIMVSSILPQNKQKSLF